MAFKAVSAFFASVLLIQSTYGQIAAPGLGAGWGQANAGWNGLGVGLNGLGMGLNGLGTGLNGLGVGLNGLGTGLNGIGGCGCGGVASTGGGLVISSASPIAPTGVTVVSENAYAGELCAGGNLPLLGTVALEGVLPTAGAGAVSYGCGDGAVGIAAEEGPVVTGIVPNAAPGLGGVGYGLGYNGLGYGLGAGYGCGCGGIY